MNRPEQDQNDLAAILQEWLNVGYCAEPADRDGAESAVRDAFRAIGHDAPSLMFIWVQSPMAGVLATASVGFALGAPLKTRMMQPLDDALRTDNAAAQRVRHDVDANVWHVARAAVHRQVEAELGTRGAAWEAWKKDMGNYAWNQVWETVGDQLYSQGWERQAQESEGLFEANLAPWADAMMDGQFSAGSFAQLQAQHRGVEPTPFAGLQRLARSCGWWWGFEAGAVLCERPARFELSGDHATIEFRDGWTVRT